MNPITCEKELPKDPRSFKFIDKIKNTQAKVSLFELLQILEPHREMMNQFFKNSQIDRNISITTFTENVELWSKGDIISFHPSEMPSKDVTWLHPPLFIEVNVIENIVKRSLINGGAALKIATTHLLSQFDPNLLPPREETTMKVKGFNGVPKKCAGIIILPIKVGNKVLQTLFYITYGKLSFNFILGRPSIDDMKGVASTLHRCFKFFYKGNFYKVEANEQIAKQCNYVFPKRFVLYDAKDEDILVKNDQIYRKALQRINIKDIRFGSYTITYINNISMKRDLDEW